MFNILNYYNSRPNYDEVYNLYKSFINFYIFFKNLNEKKIVNDESISFLEKALEFTDFVFNNDAFISDYFNTKQNYIDEFLNSIKPSYDKFIKNLKKTFDIPGEYSYEDVCKLFYQSYAGYLTLRFNQNLNNTKKYEEIFKDDFKDYRLPKYISEKNANINEFFEIVSGIKSISNDNLSYEWFNVFSDNLHVRVIVDSSDGQIICIYINGEENTEVSSSFIRKLKQRIKKEKK